MRRGMVWLNNRASKGRLTSGLPASLSPTERRRRLVDGRDMGMCSRPVAGRRANVQTTTCWKFPRDLCHRHGSAHPPKQRTHATRRMHLLAPPEAGPPADLESLRAADVE